MSILKTATALVLVATALVLAVGSHAAKPARPTIVLVHGDWADASSWTGVLSRLRDQGFTAVAPPNPLRGPAEDASYLASYLKTIVGPIVLVAHSYGGFVITNAATGNANVQALVYVDAFMPDEGETLAGLATRGQSCVTQDGLDPVPYDGGVDLYLRRDANGDYPGFTRCFANGVDPRQAALLAAEQRPAAAAEFAEPSGTPAWKTIPSWALIGTQDHVIPPALEEQMATRAGAHVSRVKAGHLSLITRPREVTKVILAAVAGTS
ncbi:MAG TPA: alpha/beta hydrolase [Gaiellaceae bacterium]|nr:alpha/beta hydrolase [Gaiellaceae bacterium]